MRKANEPRINVLASAVWMSGHTGRRDVSDVPKLKVTNDFNQVRYCIGRGRSRPRLFLYSASACGFTRGFRARAATGSVDERTAMNTRTLAMSRTGTAQNSRLRTNLVMVHLPYGKDRGGDADVPGAAPSLSSHLLHVA